MPLLLHQIKRLRDLKATYSYEVSKLQQGPTETNSDEDLLQLLEIIELQANLNGALNDFLKRDFAPEKTVIKVALGALAHLSSQLTIKGAERLEMKRSALGIPFIELYEDNLLGDSK